MTKDYSKLSPQERYYLHAAGVKGVWKRKKKVRKSSDRSKPERCPCPKPKVSEVER